jgi:hypothetical protein
LRLKRNRAETPEEPLRKRMKLFLKAGSKKDQDDLDSETWLGEAEERQGWRMRNPGSREDENDEECSQQMKNGKY